MGKGSGSGSGLKGGQAAGPLSVSTTPPTTVREFAAAQHHRHHPEIIATTSAISSSPSRRHRHHHHHSRSNAQPKGLCNVGNTCYANAVLQCLLSTALTHALLDPNAVNIFRHYSFNLQILQKGSGSVDSSDDDLNIDTGVVDDAAGDLDYESSIVTMVPDTVDTTPGSPSSSTTTPDRCVSPEKERERQERKERRDQRRKEHADEKLPDRCQWLTRELKTITMEYQTSSGAASRPPPISFTSWFTGPTAPVVDPGPITKYPHRLSKCLRPYQQEDAHEFLRALLSTLVMNGQNKKLSSLFDGLLESAVTCQTCYRPSLTRDRYMDLSLDIHGDHIETLEDALEEFTKTETLSGDNKVYCAKCETKRTATKGLRLATAPSILVCHFKRFAYNDYGGLVRLNKQVGFPLQLEIGDYMSNLNQARPPPYELVAVLVHQGQTCDSGHYVAYVKSGGQWYCCNDDQITSVDVGKVMTQQAYIVMYEVAEMRERHGYYPSPSGSATSGSSSSTSQYHTSSHPHYRSPQIDHSFMGMLCAMNDSILRDLCGSSKATNDSILRDLCGSSKATNNGVVSTASVYSTKSGHRKKEREHKTNEQRSEGRRQARSQEPTSRRRSSGNDSPSAHIPVRCRASSAILNRHAMLEGQQVSRSTTSGAGDLATGGKSTTPSREGVRKSKFRRASSSTDLKGMQKNFSSKSGSSSPKNGKRRHRKTTMSAPRQRPSFFSRASDPGVGRNSDMIKAAAAAVAASESSGGGAEEEGEEHDLRIYQLRSSGSGSPSSKERWASSNSPTYHSGELPPRPHPNRHHIQHKHRRRNSSAKIDG